MRKIITILTMAITATAYGQADTDIVDIPDENFREILLNNTNINKDKNNYITNGEARDYRSDIYVVGSTTIRSLKGIEAFVNIKELRIRDNTQLTSLDLSKNTKLQFVYCNNNQQLTSLNVNGLEGLMVLYCDNNRLTRLDASGLEKLRYLYCQNNQLTSLNISGDTDLISLYCQNNQLTSLDISTNKNLGYLYSYNNQLTQLNVSNGKNDQLIVYTKNNPNLKCIQIDRGFTPPSSRWEKDTHAVYSHNCKYPALSTNEKSLAREIKVINPVKDNLIIKTDAKIERVEIYNTAGQLVKVLFKSNTNVQDLPKGTYLIKITTDQGVSTEKIIKN